MSVTYPQTDPKQWGPKYWYYLHENAALYPDQPTQQDIENEKAHINYVLTHLPCKETCEPNVVAYVQQHPPDLTTKKAYFTWLVSLHNEINQETGSGQRIDDAESLLGDSKCTTCGIPQHAEVDEVSHDADAELSDSVKNYKESVRTLVKQVYKKAGKEPPEIIFNRCGDGTETSCMMVVDGKRYTFYHPRDLLKTIYHEIDHGIDSAEGKEISDTLNDKANKYATSMVDAFPYDELVVDKKGNISVAHDTTIIKDSVPIPNAATASSSGSTASMVADVYGQPSVVSNNPNDPTILSDFPHLRQTLMEIKKEELKGEIREFERKGGVLSHFDKIYEAPAGWCGLKPEELNLIHTPVIMGQVLMTLTGAYLSPLTRTLLNSLLGIVLMVIGLGIHSRIPTRDVQLIQALGSQLTWGTAIPSLNPKNARRIKHDFGRIADGVKTRKFHAGDLIETPNQEEAQFKPQVFNPSFDQYSAFMAEGNGKRGIPTDPGEISDVSNLGMGGSTIRGSEKVIRLPKFSSRSHGRFF